MYFNEEYIIFTTFHKRKNEASHNAKPRQKPFLLISDVSC